MKRFVALLFCQDNFRFHWCLLSSILLRRTYNPVLECVKQCSGPQPADIFSQLFTLIAEGSLPPHRSVDTGLPPPHPLIFSVGGSKITATRYFAKQLQKVFGALKMVWKI